MHNSDPGPTDWKHMRSTRRMLILVLAFCCLLTACPSGNSAQTKAEKALESLPNGLSGGTLDKTSTIAGEKFDFIASYSTSYDTDS